MNKIKLNINQKEYTSLPGKTVLEVIRENNIDDIPTLCHDERLKPYGSCFLCVVEIEGFRTLKPSCATPVADNMVIRTNTPKVMEARKTALELILSNHYADCIAPCTQECPAGVDIQGYIALASMGKYEEAIELIKETNPLPLVCGRVCTRPCELACRRNNVDEGLAIDFLKRYCADIDMVSRYRKIKEPEKPNGKRVAIIGAGPAGLSAGYYLSLQGFECEIFERLPEPGGMLRWGIPAYRLPRDVLAKEISFITDMGVKIHTGREWGRDFTLKSLKRDFDAVFIGIGSQKSTSMRIKGEEHPDILEGIIFLRDFEKGVYEIMGKKVVIIGGGNTAIDCSRTALRLGADKVILLYRRTRKEMPANDMEIAEAEKEGVEMHFLSAPVSAEIDSKGIFLGLNCIKMELGEPDASGRRRPVPVENSEHLLACDMVISAIGQQTDLAFLKLARQKEDEPLEEKLAYTKWNTFEADEHNLQTSLPGIFAGGDIVTGPWIAINAIAEGRKAANGISLFLSGKAFIENRGDFYSLRKNLSDKEYVPEVENAGKRAVMPELPLNDREGSFQEVELGLKAEDIFKETGRCLSCGCLAVFDCDLKKYAGEHKINLSDFKNRAEFRDQPLKEVHPFINYELNKCILCGKCVRVCDEVRGVWAISFTKRGFNAEIQPVLDRPLLESDCISCGECLDICPVGALSEQYPSRMPGPFVFESHKSNCILCSNLCNISYLSKAGTPLSIRAEDHALTPRSLCLKGRFGLTRLHEDYTQQDIRDIQKEQIKEMAYKIKAIKGKKTGLYLSPYTTNEEGVLLRKLARALGIRSPGILSAYLPKEVLAHAQKPELIKEADLVIALNPDRNQGNPVMDVILRGMKAQQKDIIVLCGDAERIWNSGFDTVDAESDKDLEILIYTVLRKLGAEESVALHPGYQTIRDTGSKAVSGKIQQDAGKILEALEKHSRISLAANYCSVNAVILLDMLRMALEGTKEARLHLFDDGINLKGLYDAGFYSPLDRDISAGIFYGENPYLDSRLKDFADSLQARFFLDEFNPGTPDPYVKLPPFFHNSGSFTLFDKSSLKLESIPFHRPSYSRTEILKMLLDELEKGKQADESPLESEDCGIQAREIYQTNTLKVKMDEFIKKYKLRQIRRIL